MGKTVENASAHPPQCRMRPIAASDSAQMPCHGLLHWHRGWIPLRRTANSWPSGRRTNHSGTLFMTALLPQKNDEARLCPKSIMRKPGGRSALPRRARLTSTTAHLRMPVN